MFRILSASLILCCISLGSATEGQAPWRSLPAETVIAISCPDWAGFAQRFMKTRYGQAIFTAERRQALLDMVAQGTGTDPDQWPEMLGKWDLRLEDCEALMAGPSGLALTLYPAADRSSAPLAIATGWLTPGNDLSDRLLGALDKLLARGEDEGEVSRREQDVNQRPLTTVIIEGQPHFFVGREGNTIAWAIAFYDDPELAQSAEAKALDIIDNLLSGRSGAFGSVVDDHPGTAAIRSPGRVLIDIHVHLPALMACLPMHEQVGPVTLQRLMEILGFNGLDLMSLRCSLTETGRMHTNAFMGAPAPRRGLPALLDVDEVDLSPPAWADAETLTLISMACDLPALYNTIKKIAVTLSPEPGTNQFFLAAEMQTQMVLGAPHDIALASFTAPMQAIQFPIDSSHTGGVPAVPPMAVGWNMANPAVARQLLQVIGVGLAALGAQPIDEEGITGHRVPNPMGIGQLGALLFGGSDQSLVMAIGEGTEERIRGHMATGTGTLADAPWLAAARALLPRQRGLVLMVADDERGMQSGLPFFKDQLRTSLAQSMAMGVFSLPPGIGPETLVSLIPSAEEMVGTLGVSAGVMWVEDFGLIYQNNTELPMAE